MRKIREVLRLKLERGLSNRQIGLSCSIGRTTVQEYLERASKAGLTWPLPENLDDNTIEQGCRSFETKVQRSCAILFFPMMSKDWTRSSS